MSEWKIRHAGSPVERSDLTPEQIVQGVRDGVWEPTDEVMGPGDAEWVTIESHSTFEEVMLDLEPEPPRYQHDETKLDMNPLIDVALVLLIFFILTTTYQSLRRVIDMPYADPPDEGARQVPQIPLEEAEERAIFITAVMEDGKPVIRIGDRVMPSNPIELQEELTEEVKRTGKTEVLLDAVEVPWGTVTDIIDASTGAGIQQILQQVSPDRE